ncbi:MAG: hypothetical protein ABSC23_12940 [Bryobacteraceae bacterium]|jgi:hypothetical protein
MQIIFDDESALVGFREGLLAGQATKAPESVAVVSEALGCVAARGAIHRIGFCFFRFHTSILQQLAAVYKRKVNHYAIFFALFSMACGP